MRIMKLMVVMSLFIGAAVPAGGCAKTGVQGTQAALIYLPERQPTWSLGPDTAALSALTVHDERPADARSGQRFAEKDGSRAPIEFAGGLEAWTEEAFRDLLRAGAVRFAPSGERSLVVRIEDAGLQERIVFQSSYSGRVALTVEVLSADGRTIWSRRATGQARNWGRPGTDINYSETMNHALYRAAEEALGDPGFAAAMRGK